MSAETKPVDARAVLNEAQDWLYRSSECRGDDERAAAVKQVCAAVEELYEADHEYDAARRDWDLIIMLGDPDELSSEDRERISARFENAAVRRMAALARIGGAMSAPQKWHDLDGSAGLRTELAHWLHGDPRYSEPAAPPPRLLERHRDLIARSYQHVAPTNPDQDE